MGSVKDLMILEMPEEKKSGRGRFSFSDRYSVFDWGKMPDDIQNKGAALCIISAYLLEKLEEMGIRTHYLGVVEDDAAKKAKKLNEVETIPACMEVKLVRVIKPPLIEPSPNQDNCYDYSCYNTEQANLLIPLEVIYRNYLPDGSSVFKRLKGGSPSGEGSPSGNGQLTKEDLGLTIDPVPGQKLDPPMFDFSTKLEPIDRYISQEEAKNISGLLEEEFCEILRITRVINGLISEEAGRIGLVNEDGKVEFGFDPERRLILVDVLGTPDECRFTFNGLPVSKEVARIFYRKTQWFQDVEKAKKASSVLWKEMVCSPPPSLPLRLCELISMLYQSVANEMTGRVWFKNIPGLNEILGEISIVVGSDNLEDDGIQKR